MGRILSAPTTLRVVAQGASALSQLASSMAPGSWAQLTTTDIKKALLSISNGGGVGGNNIPYANQMAWNSFSKQIQFAGSDHGASYMPEIIYDEATNSWSIAKAEGLGSGTHAYGQFQVRPDNGDRYTRHNGGGNTSEPAYRKMMGATAWTRLTETGSATYTQIGVGTAWWPGANSGKVALSGMGAAGCYIIFEISLGTAMAFDPLANTWTALTVPKTYPPLDPYHTVAAYSSQYNCVVYGGGNGGGGNNRRLWRLNQDRSVTELTICPVNIGVQAANLQVDPVTGKFLIWGGGNNVRQFYELDPTGAGTYKLLGGSRQPPATGLNGVSDPSGGPGGPDALVSCALPDHGVVAYISASGASYANFFLYKHA